MELKKAWAEIGQLGGELTRLREEVRSLRPQLEQEKTATANAVSEYQTSEEMVVLKKSLLKEASRKVHMLSHITWQPRA